MSPCCPATMVAACPAALYRLPAASGRQLSARHHVAALTQLLRHNPHANVRPRRPLNFCCQANEEPPWVRQDSESTGADKPGTNKDSQKVNPQDAKGQRTAIITGFVSVAFGVLYLLGVSVLGNSRGATLQPPPPEAFGL